MNMIFDVIIIGSGPAGLAAAIYAQRAQLKTLIIEKMSLSGGQILNTYEVDNYPGFIKAAGFDLGMKFREHADSLEAEFLEGEVIGIELDEDKKIIKIDNGKELETKALIIATGAVHRKLDVKGEEKLLGMGVSYCATCDGAFFRGKEVAVVGGGDVAIEDGIFLARMCKKVYVIHRRNEFRAAKALSSKLLSLDNVEVVWDSVVESINGEDKVDSVTIKNKITGKSENIEISGIFIGVGMSPNTKMFQNLVDMDERGYIIADETCRTSTEGIFAAGDIRTKQLRQVVTAVSDGANAVTSVEKYLNYDVK